MKYEEATKILNSRGSKKVGNNTYLKKRGEYIAVMLHETDVVTFKPDGSIVLDSGGWKTRTTKDRINNYLPDYFYLYQEKSEWYLRNREKQKTVIFADGLIIGRKGGLTGEGNEGEVKRKARLRKSVSRFCKGFISEFKKGNIPEPSGGDCWMCGMTPGDGGHIISHIEEKYYVPSLLVNAISQYGAPIANYILHDYWVDGKTESDWDFEWFLYRPLRKYVINQLGL